MKIKRIFLDMDGTLVDFVGGVIELFGRNEHEVLRDWPAGVYSIHEALGLDEDAMWRRIYALGPDFWAELKPYPWTRELHHFCSRRASVTILTKPSRDGSSAHGKISWLRRFFGDKFRDYVVTPRKPLLANGQRILVDDSDEECGKFRSAGGHSVLLPQPWNAGRTWDLVAGRVEAVRRQMAEILGV